VRRADQRSLFGIEVLRPDLRRSVTGDGIEHMLAIGRKAQAILGLAAAFGCQAAGVASGNGNDPQMRLSCVRLERDIDGAERHPLAVGRHREVADTLQLHHVFEGEGALGLGQDWKR
jgi:hypothetical protein